MGLLYEYRVFLKFVTCTFCHLQIHKPFLMSSFIIKHGELDEQSLFFCKFLFQIGWDAFYA